MADNGTVRGDFDDYDSCKNCNDGWEKQKGPNGGSYKCMQCGGLGLVKIR